MTSYIASNDSTLLPYDDAFSEDPIELLKNHLTSDIFISLVQTPSEFLIAERSRSRKEIHTEWEQLRLNCRSSGVTYHEQVEREFAAEIQVSIDQSIKFADALSTGQDATKNELKGHLRMSHLVQAWRSYAGNTEDGREFGRFFGSPQYRSVPSVEISAMLIAKLLTGDRKIRHGDAMEVEHISTFLPYANIMVVDESMRNITREIKLDKKYNCRVCYIGDQSEMEEFFQYVSSTEVHSRILAS